MGTKVAPSETIFGALRSLHDRNIVLLNEDGTYSLPASVPPSPDPRATTAAASMLEFARAPSTPFRAPSGASVSSAMSAAGFEGAEALVDIRLGAIRKVPYVTNVLDKIESQVDGVEPSSLKPYMEAISSQTNIVEGVKAELLAVNELADSQLEVSGGILDDFLEKVETPRPDNRELVFIVHGAQDPLSGYQTPTAASQSSVAYGPRGTLSPEELTEALEAIAEAQPRGLEAISEEDEMPVTDEEEMAATATTSSAQLPVRAARLKAEAEARRRAAAAAAEKQARIDRASITIERRAKSEGEKQAFKLRLAELKGGVGLLAHTPRVDRTNDLAGISSAIGQINGNWPGYATTYNGAGKQCWICGLRITPGANGNQYEHVQPFKTALFESMLYIPSNSLGQNDRAFLIARQCIGEYSHKKCNGGGSTARGGRIGKGDIALKMGGKGGNWNDLVPSEANIREMLIGANGRGDDGRCVWSEMEHWHRAFYGTAEAFYNARKNIIYSRVAQVCFMVRLCVDWNKHAYAKGYALAKVATGGPTVGKDLNTYFKNTSALNPCPGDIARRFRPMFYMDFDLDAVKSVDMVRYEPLFKSTTEAEFNRSYGTSVTGIGVSPGDDENRRQVAERLAWATTNARPPVAPAVLLAASGSGSAMASSAGPGATGVRYAINPVSSPLGMPGPQPPSEPALGRARSRSPDARRGDDPEDNGRESPGTRYGRGRRPVSLTRRQQRQQKKLRTQKRRRVTTEIVPYQP